MPDATSRPALRCLLVESGAVGPGIASDDDEGGLWIRTLAPLEVGFELGVVFVEPTSEPRLETRALVVRRVDADDTDDPDAMGVAVRLFDDAQLEAVRERLRRRGGSEGAGS